ncbi:MAG TPA: DNA (cytosine-5-)-methyltransferase, partial [Phycisphaerae bacterium]|nr:DNA (cytosine-5-)-methyltransferase [Phycisphaerae bacterium]
MQHPPSDHRGRRLCGCGATLLVEPVDVICGGWPCQDLSVAGRRAGLIEGKRSSLFFEAMRIIKELQDAGVGPTFALFENVPGLLSSNGGNDFAVVLAELANVGALDIAWRVLDSQFFGVAQRRRRVFIVADFGGECAGQILALTEGLRGYPAPRR